MIGWVDHAKAEFVFVVFSNGGKHQYDHFINFNRNASSNNFELDKIEFEDPLHFNGAEPKRITLFYDGKFTGDK
jgi:hypothetical protein